MPGWQQPSPSRDRAHGNLATVGCVAQPSEQAETYAVRALTIAQRLQRTDLESQAQCYLGDARLARGDPRGEADLRRAITLAGSVSRVEMRVRCYVNAGSGAYHSGRLAEAERYVAAGLRAAADGEFFAGQYRRPLTAAAVQASRGSETEPSLVCATRWAARGAGSDGRTGTECLVRLLARRDNAKAGGMLAPALTVAPEDSFVLIRSRSRRWSSAG